MAVCECARRARRKRGARAAPPDTGAADTDGPALATAPANSGAADTGLADTAMPEGNGLAPPTPIVAADTGAADTGLAATPEATAVTGPADSAPGDTPVTVGCSCDANGCSGTELKSPVAGRGSPVGSPVAAEKSPGGSPGTDKSPGGSPVAGPVDRRGSPGNVGSPVGVTRANPLPAPSSAACALATTCRGAILPKRASASCSTICIEFRGCAPAAVCAAGGVPAGSGATHAVACTFETAVRWAMTISFDLRDWVMHAC
eukprot:CAMPEP_0179932082 /NCGR_PEP_ID=MMETSP0983-20121128/11057_1 /TAXON_ID=483367 /ORGANISM="non described non described, Strain CCMP 2436" /LENGTH=259 /DNA_ID=CAMNT_0021836621 /DNA_START=304 /DNA_END=1080 /DNA_ORIENTATION=-